jgi:hypothetical protein
MSVVALKLLLGLHFIAASAFVSGLASAQSTFDPNIQQRLEQQMPTPSSDRLVIDRRSEKKPRTPPASKKRKPPFHGQKQSP